MLLYTTVFLFPISVPYEDWATFYDREENAQMNKELGIICSFKGLNNDNPTSMILIEKGYEA